MSLGSILRALFGGSDDKPSHNRGMDGADRGLCGRSFSSALLLDAGQKQ